jgi:diguanylate cyclase (GGDEF)-like protein/PAS domain S-box-containing protein
LDTLGRAFTSSLIGMALLDLDGRWVEVNPALGAMLGRSPEQMLGHSALEHTHPDDFRLSRSVTEELLERDGRGPDAQSIEKRYIHANGSVVWARVAACLVHDHEGRPEALFIQVADVTVERQTAQRLRLADERFERVFEAAPVGMSLHSADPAQHGRVLRANQALCEILQRPASELVDLPAGDYMHPDDVAPAREAWHQLLTGCATSTTSEFRYIRGDGATIVGHEVSSLVRDESGRAIYVVAQLIDVTERWEAERDLRESRELFARAFEDAPIGMALSGVGDDHGRPLRVNAELCTMFRASPEQLRGHHPTDFAVGPQQPAARRLYDRLLTGDVSRIQAELELQRVDGTTFGAEITATLVRDGAQQPLYVVTQVQDIDDRLRGERLLREAERRFRAAFEDAGLPMSLYGIDRRIIKVNHALCEMLGYAESDLLGRDAAWFLHHDQLHAANERIEQLLRDDTPDSYTRDTRYMRADGSSVCAQVTSSLIRDDDGAPLYVVSQIEDISAERTAQALAELRMAQQTAVAWLGQRALGEEPLEALFDAAVDILAATCDVPFAALAAVQDDGRLRLLNAVGWEPGALVDAAPEGSHVAYTLAAGGPVILEDAATEDRFDTDRLIGYSVASGMSVVIGGVADEPFGVLSLHASRRRAFSTDDIAFLASVANVLTAAIRRDGAARDLRHQSLHDPLTGLPNRALLLDRLRQGMARARRDGTVLAVLFCDMDDFKYVNDTLGHDAGDRLLSTLAPRLANALRATDTLARFGGDEFVALCEGLSDPAEVVALADRLLDAASEPVDLGGTEFVPTASIGIALAPAGGDSDPEALLRDADVAMYGAKSGGKGRYELFDAEMRRDTIDRVGLLAELRHAVPRGELVVEFQPIVSLRRREVAGLECLVRWRHPTRGLLMPDQFIGLAEDSSLIQELGRWVIDQAVARTAAWKRAGVPVLERVMTGVNVSWRQISHGTLVADVRAALDRHGLDPASLCVEITESAIMEDPQRATAVLGELAELGVHLGLDDFGTGHSSLAVLRNFPFDMIKLDRSFLAGEEWAVVRAVTQMARSLDLLVVAEGVERPAQDHRAAELDCDFGQGWLYAAAMGADALAPAVLELESTLRQGRAPGAH